tara:strand:- start:3437 stop:3892 length:456 start_codon:yes stop_codon:yes gene_type:complete
MKNNFLFILFLILSCQESPKKEESVLLNKDSDEIVFILELSTKENSVEDVEDFTQYLSDFIVKREPSTVYGYFISEDGKNVTLIERYNNSDDGIQHGVDFINGPNFERFFEIFTIESFITLGNATDEFKKFASENGFEIDYRESIGGYVRK